MRVSLIILFSAWFSYASGQNKKAVEISLSINSVDRVFALGNLSSVDSKLLDGGNRTNKSIATGLLGKYFIADNLAIRLRTIYTKKNIAEFRELSIGSHSVYDIHIRQELLKIAPGVQWSAIFKKVAFFGGLDIPITFHGKITESTYNLDENLNGTNQSITNITYSMPGGTSFGLGVFAGSNYYILKQFAVGFEFGTAYQYTSLGGTLKNHAVTTGAYNNDSYSEHTESLKEMKFAEFQANINLTFKL